MGKTKQKQLVAIPAKKNNASIGLLDPSNFNSNTQIDDSWVIVKKQRVTILVPALPVLDGPRHLNPEEPSQLQALPGKRTGDESEVPNETWPRIPTYEERNNFLSAAPRKTVQLARKPSPASNFPRLTEASRQNFIMESRNSLPIPTLKPDRFLGVSKASKTITRPRLSLHCPGSLPSGGDGSPLNLRLRALNLERKLEKAGGLSRWLASLGLEQFVRLFQGKGLNKFQLVNLSMKKLKDMGANAVGPRRKLMHAIDCICQPYCFKAF
ncbi:hypothetical protein UlMin_005324 [Ulmus minor]